MARGHITVETCFKANESRAALVDISYRSVHLCRMTDIIDTRGLMCPLPVLRLGKVLRDVPSGSSVTILADDPIAIVDIPHFCTESGHRLVSQEDCVAFQRYVVQAK